MKQQFWRVLKRYLRQKAPITVVFLLFSGVFAAVFSLYQLEIEAIGYAVIWCVLLSLVFFGVDFARVYRHHQQLMRIEEEVTLLAEHLPAAQTLMEEDYQILTDKLLSEYKRSQTTWQTQRMESIDYYTTWAHQIKTPIAVMRMILQSEDTEEHRELQAELFRIEQYVEMVLCYFRLDSHSSDFVFQQYALDGIIKQAVRKYAPQFVRKRIQLHYQGTDTLVLTDAKWLGFILEQLLSNAIKYTERGAITIAVDAQKCLSISDTGIGIAAEDLPRVFEKGFTGYNGRANKKSTGLGLYLCKQAADKLSHRISIHSEVGKGTTVQLDLQSISLQVE